MPKILILGAHGRLARDTTGFFLKHPEVQLTLYLRRANRLSNPAAPIAAEVRRSVPKFPGERTRLSAIQQL